MCTIFQSCGYSSFSTITQKMWYNQSSTASTVLIQTMFGVLSSPGALCGTSLGICARICVCVNVLAQVWVTVGVCGVWCGCVLPSWGKKFSWSIEALLALVSACVG